MQGEHYVRAVEVEERLVVAQHVRRCLSGRRVLATGNRSSRGAARAVVPLLAGLIALLAGSPALAVPGIPSSGAADQGGYLAPEAGANPHGGYSTTTNKCKVCHAVHGATPGGQKLMRTENASSTNLVGGSSCSWCHPIHPPGPAWPDNNGILEPDNTSTPCVYCHISGPFAITKVYGGDPNNYWMESTKFNYLNNHASSHAMGSSVYYRGCPSCHSVHGANIWDPDTGDANPATYILRNSPGPSLPDPVSNMDDFCRDCHDMTGQNGAIDPSTGATCGRHCHKSWLYPTPGSTLGFPDTTWARAVGLVTKSGSRDGQSHIMTTTLTNATGQPRALAGTPECRSCHSGGDGTAGNSWPHMTAGAAFLPDYHTVATQLDRVCLDCHDDGVAGSGFGVGDSY